MLQEKKAGSQHEDMILSYNWTNITYGLFAPVPLLCSPVPDTAEIRNMSKKCKYGVKCEVRTAREWDKKYIKLKDIVNSAFFPPM